MKQIEFLAECVSVENSSSITRLDEGTFIDLGNEIQTTLPAVWDSIQNGIRHGFKKTSWVADTDLPLEVGTVVFTKNEESGLEQFMEDLKLKQKRYVEEKSVFVIAPLSAEELDMDPEVSIPNNPALLSVSLTNQKDFKVYFLLSDRSDFIGSDIIVEFGNDEVEMNGSELYEEEITPESFPNYRKPSLDTILIEKGSLLIVNKAIRHGIAPLRHGTRLGLEINLAT